MKREQVCNGGCNGGGVESKGGGRGGGEEGKIHTQMGGGGKGGGGGGGRKKGKVKMIDEMGHYSTRSKYCEVIVNGSYQGIYMLMENIKRDNNRVDMDIENTGINSGVYILKNDYWDGSNSWLLNYHPIDHPTLDVHLVYHYPDPSKITPQQKTYIQTFVNDFESALYSPNFWDTVNVF